MAKYRQVREVKVNQTAGAVDDESQSLVAKSNPYSNISKVIAAIKMLIEKQEYATFIQLINALLKSKQAKLEELLNEYKAQGKVNKHAQEAVVNAPKQAANNRSLLDLVNKLNIDKEEIETAISGLEKALTHFQAQIAQTANQKTQLQQQITQATQQVAQLTQQRTALVQSENLGVNPAYARAYLANNQNVADANPDAKKLLDEYEQDADAQPTFIMTQDQIDALPEGFAPKAPISDVNEENDINETPYYERDEQLENNLAIINVKARENKTQIMYIETRQQSYEADFVIVEKQDQILTRNSEKITRLKQSLQLVEQGFLKFSNDIQNNSYQAEEFVERLEEIVNNKQLRMYKSMIDSLVPFPNSAAYKQKERKELEEELKNQGYNSTQIRNILG